VRRREFFGSVAGLSLGAFFLKLSKQETDWYTDTAKISTDVDIQFEDNTVKVSYKWNMKDGRVFTVYHDITLEPGLDSNDPSVRRVIENKIENKRLEMLERYRMLM
jgi:hypothetical protein